MGIKSFLADKLKLNPAQTLIKEREPNSERTLVQPYSASRAYKEIGLLNRVVNMVIDSAAECSYDVGPQNKNITSYGTIKQTSLDRLLNIQPNPFMDVSTFRRLVTTDLLFEGCAYIHYDGSSLYHVPAAGMEVKADAKKFINEFVFDGRVHYKVNEIIFIKDNAFQRGAAAQITGQSRIQPVLGSLNKAAKMQEFKEKFLDNGTVIGLILETDEVLNKKLRERKQEEMQLDYNPRTGKSTVLILDGGMKAKPYSQISSFKDLDFESDLTRYSKDVCITLGVPQVLIDGGNNANIRPNVELLYYMTIVPMLNKLASSVSFFFGFPVKPTLVDVVALTPDRDSEAKYITSLVNNGIMTGNEGRTELRLEPIKDPQMEKIRIPANVAGSATGVSGQEGGRPTGSDNEEE